MDSLLDLKKMGITSAGIDLRKRPPALAKAVGEMCFEPSKSGRERLVEMVGGATTRGLYQRGV